jgi:antitoxin component of MazEF toxin-antitoxin module
MELTKQIKKYGGSYVITFSKQDRELYSLFQGLFLTIEIKNTNLNIKAKKQNDRKNKK